MFKLAWSLDLKEKETLTLMFCMLSKEWHKILVFQRYQEFLGKCEHKEGKVGNTPSGGRLLGLSADELVGRVKEQVPCRQCSPGVLPLPKH